jgi:hypothetical protein
MKKHKPELLCPSRYHSGKYPYQRSSPEIESARFQLYAYHERTIHNYLHFCPSRRRPDLDQSENLHPVSSVADGPEQQYADSLEPTHIAGESVV